LNLDPITPVVITDPIISNSSIYTSNPVFRDANGNPYGISSIVGQEMSNPVAYVNTRLGNYNWSDDFIGNVFAGNRFAGNTLSVTGNANVGGLETTLTATANTTATVQATIPIIINGVAYKIMLSQ
jgi:hypothetical protein